MWESLHLLGDQISNDADRQQAEVDQTRSRVESMVLALSTGLLAVLAAKQLGAERIIAMSRHTPRPHSNGVQRILKANRITPGFLPVLQDAVKNRPQTNHPSWYGIVIASINAR